MSYRIIQYRHTYSSDICLEIYEADVDYGVKMTEIDFTPQVVTVGRYVCKCRLLFNPYFCSIE